MDMDKRITVIRKGTSALSGFGGGSWQSDRKDSGYVPGTREERLSMVWQLTCEAVSLGKKYDVEQPLQRHIVTIVRKES